MTKFLFDRLAQSLIVLFVMSFVIYGLIGLMPGDPIDFMISADPRLTAADAARLKALYGLDRPIHQRYLAWLGAALQGDFGYSRLHAQPVLEILLPRLGNTVLLMGASFLLSVLIALPAGIYAAIRPYSRADYGINLLCFAGISVPPFWLALMLIIIFSVKFPVLPAGGIPTGNVGGLWEQLRYLILPVATLTIASVGGVTRFARAAMRETLREDFIRTAHAKGAGTIRVLLGHALRHAMIPVVTILALNFGALFSGALITEYMFAYPGMGKLLFDAVMNNDFNLALIGLLLATALTLACNFTADMVYARLDPRISFPGERADA